MVNLPKLGSFIERRSMRKVIATAIAAISVVLFASPSFAADVKEVLERLNANSYNPSVFGLRSLSAVVEIPGLKENLRLRPGFEQLDFTIQYLWSESQGETFNINDLPPEFDYLESNIVRMLVRDGVEVIPKTYASILDGYDLKLRREVDGYTIVATTSDPTREVQSMVLRIDKKWRVIEFKSYSETEKRHSKFEYVVREGITLLVREKSLVEKPTRQYLLVREIQHEQINGFWLVNQLTIRYTDDRDNNLAPPKVMRFHKFKVN
jgi:hypothetical protein